MLRFLKTFVILVFISGCASVVTPSPEGTFYGYLPCSDCNGISYQLELTENSTYLLKTRKENHRDILTYRGTYTLDKEGKLLLIGKTGEVELNHLRLKSDTLFVVNNDGSKVSPQAELSKMKPAGFSMTLKKSNAAKSFTAKGNEPFWNIEIETNGAVKLSALLEEKIEFITSVTDTILMDEKTVKYIAAKGEKHIEIIATLDRCADSMSGEEFGVTTTVNLNKGSGKSMTLKGCGKFGGDYRLNDIWVLTRVNKKELNTKKGRVADIEFQIKEGRLGGYSGCNSFGGNFEFFNGKLKTSNLTSTLMACDNSDVENSIFQILNNSLVSYKVNPGTLTLWNDKGSLQFKKVD